MCKNGISCFLKNVHDKIKNICIWPSASKAYVYKKKYMECKVLIHGNVQFMQMYSRLMCKATVCARLTLQWKRLKTEIMNPGGGKSLKSRIVHGMFTAIASPAQTYLYKENLSSTLNLHDDI